MSLETVFKSNEADEKSLKFIIQAIEKSNLEGFDYLEFIKAVERLKDLPMDEDLAFRSAYSTVSTVGLTKERLEESANYYLDVLEKEQKVFKQTVEDRKLIKIKRQKKRVESLEQEVEKLTARITEIKAKIVQYEQEQDEIKLSLNVESEKIMLTEKAFDDTIAIVIAKIKKDINNINRVI